MNCVLTAASVMMVALSLAACGNQNCKDAANAVGACITKLGKNGSQASSSFSDGCPGLTCSSDNRQQALSCVTNLECGTTTDTYAVSVNSCLTSNGCAAFFKQ